MRSIVLDGIFAACIFLCCLADDDPDIESMYVAPHGTINFNNSNITLQDVDADLFEELAENGSTIRERHAALELALRPMYGAFKKDAKGFLDHALVRYALHRTFVQLHGWYVKGLEPDRGFRTRGGAAYFLGEADAHSAALKEWVPAHMLDAISKKLGRRGLTLRELAALAAVIEDVAGLETSNRVNAIYGLLGFDTSVALEPENAHKVIDLYMVIYLRGGNFTTESAALAQIQLAKFKDRFKLWPRMEEWLRNLEQTVRKKKNITGDIDYNTIKRVAEAVGTEYGTFDTDGCVKLKEALVKIEGPRPARVRLKEFYRTALTDERAPFRFTEKPEFLRDLGALDESDPADPTVIIPNYVVSRPQCLESSDLYAICCRNECEQLMGHLETQIAAPWATKAQIIDLVSALPSKTVVAPRELPARLIENLGKVAEANKGRVPLHGRLFAQFLHHAYPHECPYPHEADKSSPRSPDEWAALTETSEASLEFMLCHIEGNCSKSGDEKTDDAGGPSILTQTLHELREPASPITAADDQLPWTDAEELIGEDDDMYDL